MGTNGELPFKQRGNQTMGGLGAGVNGDQPVILVVAGSLARLRRGSSFFGFDSQTYFYFGFAIFGDYPLFCIPSGRSGSVPKPGQLSGCDLSKQAGYVAIGVANI